MRAGLLLVAAWSATALGAADPWLVRLAPALTAEEKKLYRSLSTEGERDAFRRAFWRDKAIPESEYLQRLDYVDGAFGSGQTGSGANTDQGRVYLANGAPNSVHRLPSSRVFVPCEVWYYDSLPRTGYRSRLQFLFYKKAAIGDFRLYSPQLNTIRALLIPQPATRGMFPVNDEITANDIRNRLKSSPAEEEIVEAATGVARGVTGVGNGEILSRAVSTAHMIRREPGMVRTEVESRFEVAPSPDLRVLQFWAGDTPVVDVQLRVRAAARIRLAVDSTAGRLEETEIPLGFPDTRSVVCIQRFFLLPGQYSLAVEVDGNRSVMPLRVNGDKTAGISGEGLEEKPGDIRIALTPDPRGPVAQEAIARQNRQQDGR